MVETRSTTGVKKRVKREGAKTTRTKENKNNFAPPPMAVMVTPRKEVKDEGGKKRKAMTPENEPPRSRAKVELMPKDGACWSDRSNVGNLSIREKLLLSMTIFCSLVLAWTVCFSLSVCGKVASSTPTYTQDLTICRTTWSTLGWLADNIFDGRDELNSLRRESRSVHEQIQAYERTNIILEDSFKQTNSTLSSQIRVLQQSLETEKRQVHVLEVEVSKRDERVSVLNSQIQTLQQSLEAESRQVHDLGVEMSERDQQIKKLIVSMGKMEREKENSVSSSGEIQSKCSVDAKKNEAVIQDLKAEKEKLSKELTLAVQGHDKTQKELVKLRKEKESQQDAAMKVSAAEYETIKKALSELQSKHTALQGDNANNLMLSKDLAMVKRDYAESVRQLEKLQKLHEAEQVTTKQLTAQLEATKASIKKLEKEHDADRTAQRAAIKQVSSERDALQKAQAKFDGAIAGAATSTDREDLSKTAQPKKKRQNPFRRIFSRKGKTQG